MKKDELGQAIRTLDSVIPPLDSRMYDRQSVEIGLAWKTIKEALPQNLKQWRLGVDLATNDNLLDGVTFDDLILALHCNCVRITPQEVKKQLMEIIDNRFEDMNYLLENNMDAIIREAMKGRMQHED